MCMLITMSHDCEGVFVQWSMAKGEHETNICVVNCSACCIEVLGIGFKDISHCH